MSTVTRKVILTQLTLHLVTLLVIVVMSIVFLPAGFESSFMGSWIFGNSLIQYLNYFIPLVVSGIMISFSMLVRPGDQPKAKPGTMFPLIQGTLSFLLILLVVYTFMVLLILPYAQQARNSAEFRSDFINARLENARTYIEKREYDSAAAEIDAVLEILPLHPAAAVIHDEIQDLMPDSGVRTQQPEEEPKLPLNLGFGEVLDRANTYFQQGDYFSAVFYARIALGPGTDGSNPEARRILSESLEEIERIDLSQENEEKRDLYEIKRLAVRAYEADEFLEAFFHFSEVQTRQPNDPDARVYMSLLRPRVEELSFTLDEIQEAGRGDIRRHIFVRVPSSPAEERMTSEGREMFLAADEMMRSSGGLYFINLELMEISSVGNVSLHIRAPWAKLRPARSSQGSSYLILTAFDNHQRGTLIGPEYIRGSNALPNILELDTSASLLWAVNPSSSYYDDSNILQLFSLAEQYPEYGRNPLFPQMELLAKLLLPFSLINLSLLALVMGWRGRSRHLSGPPGILLIFVPLVPVFTLLVFELYMLIWKNLLASVLTLGGMLAAAAVLIGAQTLIFILVLLFLAGQSPE